MKPTNNTTTDKVNIKKEWSSPRLSELPVEQTNQLPPPEPELS
jgi:hypothetical protein